MADLLIELRVPPALRERVAATLRITDGVASDQLDEDYRDVAAASSAAGTGRAGRLQDP